MATADSVKAKIQGLIALANTKTGNTDADLTTAVNALIAGFGQGGGETVVPDSGNKLYSFGALADVHIGYGDGEADLRRAVQFLQSNGAEFICISGDITNASSESQLQTYKGILDEFAEVPVYGCNGNHDSGFTNENWNAYVGHNKNHVFEYKDDVFVFLPLKTGVGATDNAPYGEETINWLKEQLLLHKGQRIFVFTHFPLSGYSGLIDGTYYGFSQNSSEDDEILNSMVNTKNVLHISGHTHFFFDVEETYENINAILLSFCNCATVHVPSANYPRNASNTADDSGSQGYMVNVYENAVVLRAVDFVQDGYLAGYEYVFRIKNGVHENSNALVISADSMTVDEGKVATFTVKLYNPISEDVTVNLSVDNQCISLDKSSLVFTADNYNVEQTVTVTSAEDSLTTDVFSVVTIESDGIASRELSVTILNNDEQNTDDPVDSEYIQLTWRSGYITTTGELQTNASGYITDPFNVESLSKLQVYSDSKQIYNSSNTTSYVYFYTSEEISATTFVARIVLTLDDITEVEVPSDACYAVLRSVQSAPSAVSLKEIANCIVIMNPLVNNYLAVSDEHIVIRYSGSVAVHLLCPITEDTTVSLIVDNKDVTLDKNELVFTAENYSADQIVTVYSSTKCAAAINLYINGVFIRKICVTAWAYSWVTGYVNQSTGELDDTRSNYFRTTPIDVVGTNAIKVYVDSNLPIENSSSAYVIFYSSENVAPDSYVSNARISTASINEVTVPNTAVCALLRSPNTTASDVSEYIYFTA